MHHARLLGLLVVVGCSSKGADPAPAPAPPAPPPPTTDAAASDASIAVDAAVIIDASLAPDATLGAAAPEFQPACASGAPVAALAGLGLEDRCKAAPATQFAAATIGGKRVVVVGLDGSPIVYVGKRAIDDMPTGGHSGGEWWVLEQLEKQLGGRKSLAKLGDADAAALLGALRALRVHAFPKEQVARVGLTEATVTTLKNEWPPIKASGDIHARSVDPSVVYLHATSAGRTLGGWYETNAPTKDGDCIRLHELSVSVTTDGKLELGDDDYLERGAGCPVSPPDKPNVFPD